MTIPKQLLNAKICNRETCAEVEQLNSLVNSCQEEIRTLKEELEKKNKKYWQRKCFEYQVENRRLNNDIKILLKENEAKEKVIIKQDNVLNDIKFYIKNSDLHKMLWGKELLKILDREE